MKKIFLSVLATAFTCTLPAQSGICLTPTTNLSSGNNIRSAVTADFNNDGFLDIISASNSNNGLAYVFLGNGNGTFNSPVSYSMGANARITKGDFNNDGRPDIATANEGSCCSPELSVRLNNGNGTFGAVTHYTAGSMPGSNMPVAVASQDFNGDGNADIAVANTNGVGLSILLGNGTGTFAPCVNYSLSFSPVSMISDHFNSDPYSDLALSNGTNSVAILFGSSTGVFSPAAYYTFNGTAGFFMTTGDFNGDSRRDIASAAGVLFGSSGGVFTAGGNFNISGGWGVAAADFDSDGTMDLAVNTSSNQINLLRGQGLGNFGKPALAPSVAWAAEMITGDFNNDGRPDLAACHGLGTVVEVFLNRSFILNASVSGPASSCSPFTGTLTAWSSINSYTWSTGANSSSITVAPTASTVYTVSSANPYGCVASQTLGLTVGSPTLFAIITNSFICPGGSASLSVSGASTYTWSTGATATTIPVSPSITTVYSVTGTNPQGCSSTKTLVVIVNASPILNIFASSATVCSTGSVTLSATGANSYTWSNNMTGNLIQVAPAASTCYSVTGINMSGCSSMTSICITALPLPTVTISGTNTVCSGSTASFTATGAATYSWSTGATGSSVQVSPFTNTTYTVNGTNASGCSATATVLINTLPSPTLAVLGNTTTCFGTSAQFTAGGAISYSWSTGATSASVSILAPQSGTISVTGAGANGCINTAVVSLSVNTGCSDVWPGDANSDGNVNGLDVLELGFANLSTGPSRTNASNWWTSQTCNNWQGVVSSGKNKCHADCNGDGTINVSDTLAIHQNFSLSHGFKSAAAGTQITLVSDQANQIIPGQWNKLQVRVADVASSVSIYGLVFDIDYPAAIIEQDSVHLGYIPSFFNANNQNIEFRKTIFSNAKLHAADVRTDGIDASGYGQLATFYFKVKPDVLPGTAYVFGLSQAQGIHASQQAEPFSGNSLTVHIADLLGVKEQSGPGALSIYPNPASSAFTLLFPGSLPVMYSISDLSGRMILAGEATSGERISTFGMSNGVYILQCSGNGIHVSRKLIIQGE